MSHLTDEQFESLLQGQSLENDHLQACPDCQARLREKQALASRLKTAFAPVTASDGLAQHIRSQLTTETENKGPQVLKLPTHWKRWAISLSSIAAILLLVPLLKISLFPTPAYADLLEIHQHNLSGGENYVTERDPNALARYFIKQLGFNPRLPKLDQGLALRGCCVKHFHGHIVGSYVVDSPQAIISIVVVQDTPAHLGLQPMSKVKGKTYYRHQSAESNMTCNIVALRIGNTTYCAVGEAPIEYLQSLLQQLIP